MTGVRRTWPLSEILQRFPEMQELPPFIIRCKSTSISEGRYIKDKDGLRQAAGVVVQVAPGDSLTVSFGHEWPDRVTGDRMAGLDQALLRGIVESLARRCSLTAWGCAVTTVSVMYVEDSRPMAVQVAASMAMEDMLQKTDWSSPEPPPEPKAA